MIRPRSWPVRAAVVALLALAAAAGMMLAARSAPRHQTGQESGKPVLMLLTALPIVFPETFGLQGGGSAALNALQARYRILSISVADAANLRRGRLLFIAHAFAQPAEALVELDAWVRSGGAVVLLADPMVEWDSQRPLGHSLRPPPMFTDTGLLKRWGLRLEAPDERGPAERHIGSRRVLTVSPGALFGKCSISADRLVARCAVGKGRATIIADADFLDIDRLDGPKDENLGALLEELTSIESP